MFFIFPPKGSFCRVFGTIKRARAANTDDHGRHLLIAIARWSVISNSEHVRILPPSWGTLYQLTRLPVVPKLLDQAVEF